MSTSAATAGTERADRPAERVLFRGLLDDAAVFPPASRALGKAVGDHLARSAESYGDLVGPLLLPPGQARSFLAIKRRHALRVAVVARPGTPMPDVREAVDLLTTDASVSVTGVEVGWAKGWTEAASWGVPVSVEVPLGADQLAGVEDIAAHTSLKAAVQAKFRTGSTDATPVPRPADLATVIRHCIDLDLGFKLTGGLHHALTTTAEENAAGEAQFGFLNVLAATRYALAHAAEVPQLTELLTERDAQVVIDVVTRMSEADASVVRAFFTSYGCCDVLDPLRDLSTLGLVEDTV